MSIQVLDDQTIDKIAAGEVVERPSSVVKELVENAIDAGATSITVEIKNGGIDYIRVSDNGSGIPSDECRRAFLRHATSKIVSAEDLTSIHTLGFRGEALSSIAAVSNLEVITKTAKELLGVRLLLDGAKEVCFEQIGAPDGTTFYVRNLFYNTPARKAFLKSPSTEGSYISDLLEHLAISHPSIAFQFTQNNQSRFHTSGNGDLKEVIYRVYGREVANAVIPIDVQKNGIRISGFLGKPEQVRSNRNFEIYFINGRFIRSNLVSKAIEEGFREYLMQHKFPICFLHFDIDPCNVDVNVHPTKMDVRFSDGPAFFAFISLEISLALRAKEMIPGKVLETALDLKKAEKSAKLEVRSGKNLEPFFEKNANLSIPPVKTDNLIKSYKDVTIDSDSSKEVCESGAIYNVNKATEEFVFEDEASLIVDEKSESASKISPSKPIDVIELDASAQLNFFDEKILTKENKSKYRIIGQVFDTYWLVQFERKLFIIDQHAAHEKVNYERLMRQYKEKSVVSQMLLPPIIVSLNGAEEAVLNDNLDSFYALGFEIDSFGGNEYAIRAVPTDLYGKSEKELFLDVLDELANGNSRGSFLSIEEKIASMACKASVKGGDVLSHDEILALIDELLTLENPYNCPHGRPTIIAMTESELEKKFKRIVD